MPTRPRRAGSSAGGPVNRYQKLARWNHSRDKSRHSTNGQSGRELCQEKAFFDAARPVDPDGLDFAR